MERPEKKRRFTPRGLLSLGLILAGAALLLYYVGVNWAPSGTASGPTAKTWICRCPR